MKKYIVIFMSMIMILAAAITANAEGMEISIGDTSARAGDTVIVSVNVKNNTGMALGSVKVKFDNTKLIPISASKTDVLNNCWYFTSNLEDENLDATELDEVTFSWMNVSNLTGDGALANIEFIVKEDVADDIGLSLEITELADSTQTDITASTASGKISLSSSGNGNTNDSYVVEISSTTISKGESEIGGNVNLSVYSPEARSMSFLCCIYDNAGALIATKIVTQNVEVGINEVAFPVMNAAVTGIGKYAVKVYSWDSISGMQPIADSILRTY